jgi:hypothetical protein
MSAAEQSSEWQQQQSEKATSFTPAKPEIPSDGLCPPDDADCESTTPPPPPGTMNESFCDYSFRGPLTELVAAIGLIAVVAILLAKVK